MKRIDWAEDLLHENGNYQCSCIFCYRTFQGHKRRVVCKECDNLKDKESGVNDNQLVWIVAVDLDSFNYSVDKVYLVDVVKHNMESKNSNQKMKPYFTEKEAQTECDYLNSM